MHGQADMKSVKALCFEVINQIHVSISQYIGEVTLCNSGRQSQCILLAPTLSFLVNNAEEMSRVLQLQ